MTAETIYALREHGLTVEGISATDDEALTTLISKVGFRNRKTDFIKRATEVIREEHFGRVPSTLPELLALPGVGPKMAIIYLEVRTHL